MKMKKLHVVIIAITAIVFCTGSLAYADQPPVIITQVELWGPVSFYTDGVRLCEYGEGSLGPWAIGWMELYNTKNETVLIDDFTAAAGGGQGGYLPITLGPHQHCYIQDTNRVSTRIGVGGSLGNGLPSHDNTTTTIWYSIQPFAGKVIQNYSTPKLSDDFGDTRTWQLINGSWMFREANIKHDFPVKKTLLSPSRQIQWGISIKDLKCAEGYVIVVKKSDPTNEYLQGNPACVTPSSASVLVMRGWGVPEQTMKIPSTNSTLAYYVERSKSDQVVPDLASHGLTLDLKTTSNSKMMVFLPRGFVDSQQIGDYASFNVTADGKKIDYREHLTPTDRMFLLSFPNQTKIITITPKPNTENQG